MLVIVLLDCTKLDIHSIKQANEFSGVDHQS